MPADPSIYSLVQPIKAPADPMQQYGSMMQIGNLMDAGAMNQLQRRRMETDFAEEDAFKRLFSGGRTPTAQEAVAASPTRGMQFQKSQLEQQKAQAELQKVKLETLGKSLSIHRDQLAGVNDPRTAAQWIMAGFNDPILSPILQRFGSPEEHISKIPQDPKSFQDWRMRNGLGIEKMLEMTAPKVTAVNAGGNTVFRDTNPQSPGFNATAPVQHTQTPESIATNATTRRGQDLVEARERDVPLQGAIAGAREVGRATAEAGMALPGVVANAERGIRLIDEMLGSKGKTLKPGEKEVNPHPGFQSAVGVSFSKALSPLWSAPGTDRRDFESRLEEIKGGAFMQAFQNLRGGGQITEQEGIKATKAITRMETAQSEGEFVKAAREFQDVIRTGLENAKKKSQVTVGGVLKRNDDGSFSYGFPR